VPRVVGSELKLEDGHRLSHIHERSALLFRGSHGEELATCLSDYHCLRPGAILGGPLGSEVVCVVCGVRFVAFSVWGAA